MTVSARTIALDSLNEYLVKNIDRDPNLLSLRNLIHLPIFTTNTFSQGQSNPTFLLTDAQGIQFVLRKKPPGKQIASSAHNIQREYVVMQAIHSKIPVPKVLAYIKDENALGTPFYLMEFVKGRVYVDILISEVTDPTLRFKHYTSMIQVLAQLHELPYQSILPTKSEQQQKQQLFYIRQLQTLTRISNAQAAIIGKDGIATGPIPYMDKLVDWMQKNLPTDQHSLIHGDFKLDNVMFHPCRPEIVAVLDWELCAIGHPLSDLANMLLPWHLPSAFTTDISSKNELKMQKSIKPTLGIADLDASFLRSHGIPTEDELIRGYCQLRNLEYPIPNWRFFIVFALFRTCVILQGVKSRSKLNQSSSNNAELVGGFFPMIAEKALRSTEMDLHHLSKL